MSGALHELLAVEGELDGAYKRIVEETINVFQKKNHLFQGQHKKLQIYDDDEAEKQQTPDEINELADTVKSKLAFVGKHIERYYDLLLQKEFTNQQAKADLIIDGKVIGKALPATFLLGMENRLKNLRRMYSAIPTLDSSTKWIPASDKGDDIYTTERPLITYRTKKTYGSKVLYEATEHHPAQIQVWEESINIGEYSTIKWCGMITSKDKAGLLARIDKMIIAIKRARQKANKAEVVQETIARKIMNYINGV